MSQDILESSEKSERGLRLAVTPEPDPDEREVLVAVLSLLLAKRYQRASADDLPERSQWAMAGRRAAVQGIDDGSRMGWGRSDG